MSETLVRLGWTPEREIEFEPHREDGLIPARVAVEHRSAYVLYAEQRELRRAVLCRYYSTLGQSSREARAD